MAPPPACLPAACGRVLICVAICARRLHANAHITHRHLAQASAAAQPTPSLPPLTRRMAPSTRPRALHKRGLKPEDNKLSLDNSHRGRVNEIRSSGDLGTTYMCIYVHLGTKAKGGTVALIVIGVFARGRYCPPCETRR